MYITYSCIFLTFYFILQMNTIFSVITFAFKWTNSRDANPQAHALPWHIYDFAHSDAFNNIYDSRPLMWCVNVWSAYNTYFIIFNIIMTVSTRLYIDNWSAYNTYFINIIMTVSARLYIDNSSAYSKSRKVQCLCLRVLYNCIHVR